MIPDLANALMNARVVGRRDKWVMMRYTKPPYGVHAPHKLAIAAAADHKRINDSALPCPKVIFCSWRSHI